MRRISRSSHSTHRACPRKHYLGYLKDGTGYSSKHNPMELVYGLGVHLGAEQIILGKSIDEAVKTSLAFLDGPEGLKKTFPQIEVSKEKLDEHTYFAIEMRSMAEAHLRGWYRVRWPSFNQKYEVISTEQERRTLLAPNVMLMSREDALLRERETNLLLILNWKTSTGLNEWDIKWKRDVQAWTEALAVEHEIGEPVAGCLFEGFDKGLRKKGRQYTNLIYGYKLEVPGEETRYSSKYVAPSKKSPWQLFRVWEETSFGPSPLSYWINWLSWDEVDENFATSDPIYKDDRVTQAWVNQVVRLETEIEHVLRPEVSEEEREIYFIQNFSHFNCKRCPFNDICDLTTSLKEQIEMGKFVAREDHHKMEGEEIEL